MSIVTRALMAAIGLACVHAGAWSHLHASYHRPFEAREVARIRHHLEGAETLLLAADVSRLSARQRAARARCILELRTYRLRGRFPHNHVRRDGRTPMFVDEHGTRCAMAHLIERSGERSLVARIARTQNLAHIHGLAGDPELVAWLDRNGLTADEAARIQPAYDPDPVRGLPRITTEGELFAWAAALTGAGLVTAGIGFNASIGETEKSRNGRAFLGMMGGVLGATLGVLALTGDGTVEGVGAADIAMGVVSFGLGHRQLNAKVASEPDAPAMTFTPAVWREAEGAKRVGLVMRF